MPAVKKLDISCIDDLDQDIINKISVHKGKTLEIIKEFKVTGNQVKACQSLLKEHMNLRTLTVDQWIAELRLNNR